jgi:hypothetical protein
VDDSRFLIPGDSLLVEDAIEYTVLERSDVRLGGPGAVAFSPDGRRAWLGDSRNNSILVLELEGAECSPPRAGLSMFFSADGTNEDSVGGVVLSPRGSLRFAPGRVGQAFLLDGTNSFSTSRTGYFQAGAHEMSLALYVKFADVAGERVLIDWTGENPRRGFRLLKGDDNRLLFQSWPGGGTLQSKSVMAGGAWYHLTLTRTDREIVLYVNGEPEARGSSPPQFSQLRGEPLSFGARASGQPSFRGLMDEILGYNRALVASEVKALYQLRESGPCKP